MPKDTLPPDPDAVEKWQELPQGTPSKQAMPPAAGGILSLKWLLLAMGLVGLVLLIADYLT